MCLPHSTLLKVVEPSNTPSPYLSNLRTEKKNTTEPKRDRIRGEALWAFKRDTFTAWLKVCSEASPSSAHLSERGHIFLPLMSKKLRQQPSRHDYTIVLLLPEAGDKVVYCEDAFRAFRVGTGANTVVIKGFFLLFIFSFLFLSSVWRVLARAMFR